MNDDPKTEEYWEKVLKELVESDSDLGWFITRILADKVQKEIDSTWAEDQRIILEGTGENLPKGIIYAGLDSSKDKEDKAVFVLNSNQYQVLHYFRGAWHRVDYGEDFGRTVSEPYAKYFTKKEPPPKPSSRTPLNTIRPGPGQRQPNGKKKNRNR